MTLFRILFELTETYDENRVRKALDQDFNGYGYMKRVYGLLSMPSTATVARLSVTDALTQCYNRMAFDIFMQEEIHKVERYKYPLTALLFDIRDFKTINRHHGVFEASQILMELAKFVKKSIRRTDMLFRMNGDQFLILMPHMDKDAAQEAKKHIIDHLSHHHFDGVGQIQIAYYFHTYRRGDSLYDYLEKLESGLKEIKRRYHHHDT